MQLEPRRERSENEWPYLLTLWNLTNFNPIGSPSCTSVPFPHTLTHTVTHQRWGHLLLSWYSETDWIETELPWPNTQAVNMIPTPPRQPSGVWEPESKCNFIWYCKLWSLVGHLTYHWLDRRRKKRQEINGCCKFSSLLPWNADLSCLSAIPLTILDSATNEWRHHSATPVMQRTFNWLSEIVMTSLGGKSPVLLQPQSRESFFQRTENHTLSEQGDVRVQGPNSDPVWAWEANFGLAFIKTGRVAYTSVNSTAGNTRGTSFLERHNTNLHWWSSFSSNHPFPL